MGQLYVIRHGQTTCNQEAIIQGPRVDAALSETGRQQGVRLGEAFAHTPLDAVITSPLQRARDTAQALLEGHAGGLSSQVAPELYELDFGDFCGRRMPDVADAFAQVVDAWDLGFVDQAFPGGESPALAQHRIRPVAQQLRAHVADHDVAVVAHGRINKILLATLLGRPLVEMGQYPQDNASITQIAWTEAGPVVRRINDTMHLT
ncbi:MAG: histidine phosphatase family protein [Thermoplasmatota archaeon]